MTVVLNITGIEYSKFVPSGLRLEEGNDGIVETVGSGDPTAQNNFIWGEVL